MTVPAMTVVDTIAEQVAPQRWGRSYRLFRVDEFTLRVHVKRGRRVDNIDVTLDRAHDLYDVRVHTFSSPSLDVRTQAFSLVYADQLQQVIESVTGLRALGIR